MLVKAATTIPVSLPMKEVQLVRQKEQADGGGQHFCTQTALKITRLHTSNELIEEKIKRKLYTVNAKVQ